MDNLTKKRLDAADAKMNEITDFLTQIVKSINDLSQKQPVIIEKPVQEISGTADLSKIKESEPAKTVPLSDEEIIAAGKEKAPIPPKWRKIVDDILGMDFGIDVVYPDAGSGFLFKIIVPDEKSNASESHKRFYKVDIRTKALSYSDGIEGIRKFCELIKINLEKK